ncbi:MAG: RNA methyltransferase [Proteobacteria bacterium]|nr:RNA methyltransferase [Pseudomonadota bacterium]
MSGLEISSPTNQTIKDLVRLKDRKGTWAEGSFLVEGDREIRRAIQCKFELEQIFVCRDLILNNAPPIGDFSQAKEFFISREAFAKVATRDSSDGVLAVFRTRTWTTDAILPKTSERPLLILAVEDIEKPGNLGAILRTADGAGIDAVVALGKTVDLWNPNVIRASLGGVFSVPTVFAENETFMHWCRKNNVRVVGAALHRESKSLYKTSLISAVAIVLGSEAHGLSNYWLKFSDDLAIVPMQGVCDSLNVSVAAALFAFEAVRQRNTSNS